MKIKSFLDLCSGIGGGRLGLEQAGMVCTGHADTSRLSDTTYQLMFGTSKSDNLGNLKKLRIESLPYFDMLIAGFPCQSFSVIGRRDGFEDIRGQIIYYIAEILRKSQPKVFLLENVKGLVTHEKGKTLKTILDLLNNVGYKTIYRVLTSIEHGVPQMRQRVYFIGFNQTLKIQDVENFKWPDAQEPPSLKGYLVKDNLADSERLEILKYYLNNPTNKGQYSIDNLMELDGKILDTRMNDLRIYDGKVPTLRSQRDGILYVASHRIYQLSGYEALLLQGFPKNYADRVRDVVTDRHLLMQAGNAMTVPVIRKLGLAINNFLRGY